MYVCIFPILSFHAFFPSKSKQEEQIMEICSKKPHIRYKSMEKPHKNNVDFEQNKLFVYQRKRKNDERKRFPEQEGWVLNMFSFFLFLCYCWYVRPQTMDPISGVSCSNREQKSVRRRWVLFHFFLPFKNNCAEPSEPVKWLNLKNHHYHLHHSQNSTHCFGWIEFVATGSILSVFTRVYNINMILIICWLTCHWISKLTSRTHTQHKNTRHAKPHITWHEIQLPISIYFHFFHFFFWIIIEFWIFSSSFLLCLVSHFRNFVPFGFCRSIGRVGHRAISILISCSF